MDSKKRMETYGINTERITKLYNCINSTKYEVNSQNTLKKRYILYVAKFTERKNHIATVHSDYGLYGYRTCFL